MKKEKKADRKKRKPLTIWDCQYILQMKERGYGVREIGRKMHRNHSIISRFFKRIPYSPYLASLTHLELAKEIDERTRANRKSSRRKLRLKCYEIQVYVEEKLKVGWSPEIIAGRLPTKHPGLSTNYESIYQWIYTERKELIKYLVKAGSHKRKKRSHKNKRRYKKPAAPKRSIEERSAIVSQRSRFGDWEADTMVSKQSKTALFNVVERKSRYLLLKKIDDCSAESGRKAIVSMLSKVPLNLKHTITLDNGSENSAHVKIEEELNITTFFCHPYCASEKGTVENRNAFVRRYLPKKTNFADISEEEIERIHGIHNHRPMKCLDFKTPYEVYIGALKEAA